MSVGSFLQRLRLPFSGVAELALCTVVAGAAWTRTPIGALAHNGLALVADDVEAVDLLAAFRLDLGETVAERMDTALAHGPVLGGPEGWSPAFLTAVHTQLGAEAADEVVALGDSGERLPEEALERYLLGDALRDRAMERARAAGLDEPESFEAYRAFLPEVDARRAASQRTELLALSTALDLVWPVDPEARVSSRFGYRNHPTLKRKKLHEGVDIAVPTGTPVHASGTGTVVRAKEDKVNGKHVIIDHGHGVRTAYCHGSELHVERGEEVGQAALIMDSGNTGRSSGPHLHFGLRIHGKAVDPLAFREVGGPESVGPVIAEVSPVDVATP